MYKSITTLLLMFAFTANAALINTDWLEEGDSQLISDDVTGLDWLSLSQTYGKSTNETLSLMEQGGTFEGFRYATLKETNIMMMNVLASGWGLTEEGLNDAGFIRDYSRSATSEYYQDIIDFAELFGYRYSYNKGASDHLLESRGLVYDAEEGTSSLFGVNRRYYWSKNGSYRTVFSDLGEYDSDYSASFTGQFIVRDTSSLSQPSDATEVSEPSTLAMFLFPLMGLAFTRRKKK